MMKRMTYRITLSEYQRDKLLSITGERKLGSAITTFVRSSTRLPVTQDRTCNMCRTFTLPTDVAATLLTNGESASAGLRELMGVSKSESLGTVHRAVTLTLSQYDTLKVLGSGDVSEGLKLLLGA